MIPKNDRTDIFLGPARIKVEEEIYQVFDQQAPAVVTAPTPEPPVVGDYPLKRTYTEPGFTFSTETVWSILDTTAFGGYTRSLVSSGGVLNLDNLSQGINPPTWLQNDLPEGVWSARQDSSVQPFTGNMNPALCPKIRNNQLWVGAYFRPTLNDAWQTTSFSATINSTLVSFSGANIHKELWFSYSTGGYSYFTILGDDSMFYLVRVPNQGTMAVEILNAVPWATFSYRFRVVGVWNNYVWAVKWSPDLGIDSQAFYKEVTLFNLTNATRISYTWNQFSVSVDPRTAYTFSSDGTVAAVTINGDELVMVSVSGVQSSAAVAVPTIGLPGFPFVFGGTNSAVVPDYNNGYVTISPAAASRGALTGNNANGPALSPDGAKVRWISTTSDEASTPRLYETTQLPG